MMKSINSIFLLLTFCVVAAGAAPCDELKALVDKTYGFSPAKLTPEERQKKSGEMDQVWNLVGSDPNKFVPCLRTEVVERKSDSYFRFNASNLIFQHDQSTETKMLMIDTYAGADLADINLRYWLPYVSRFGFEGLDVSKAGEAWLRFPKPLYYLPQHGTRPVNKDVGGVAIYGSMDELAALPALLKLAAEESPDFGGIVLWLLINQATSESEIAIRKLNRTLKTPLSETMLQRLSSPELIVPREGKPNTTREEFIQALNELLNDKPDKWISLTVEHSDGEKDMVAVLQESDIPLLRKVRRYYASNASPHLFEWYTSFTNVINTLRAKQSDVSPK